MSSTTDDRLAGGGFPAIDGLELVDGEASWATLRQFLTVAGQFARAISRGLLIMFDDADRLGGGEVESLGHLARSLSRDGLPVALLLSGGPNSWGALPGWATTLAVFGPPVLAGSMIARHVKPSSCRPRTEASSSRRRRLSFFA